MKVTLSNELLYDIDPRGVATVTLNRVEKHNAFGSHLIHELSIALDYLANHSKVRCVVLRGNGKHFSSGADLNWMKAMAAQHHDANINDAELLAKLLNLLDHFPHPTLCYVHGSAYGGALGLICCCDIAVADDSAQFCLSEVKLGLVPATIGPYVCRAMGARQARRYMLTAELIDAPTALDLQLIHQLTPAEKAEEAIEAVIEKLLRNSPAALNHCKELIHHCNNKIIDREVINYTSEMIANVRVSRQGQEGLSAFLEKRTPDWDNGGNLDD